MLSEDKLSKSERRRLEALNQAIRISSARGQLSDNDVLATASQFESFIKEGTIEFKASKKAS